MLEIIKELYLAGYRFYINDNVLFLNSKNVTNRKDSILKELKEDLQKKERIKKEVESFKQIELCLNDHTLKEVTYLMSNKDIEIINCDTNIITKTIILVFKVKDFIDNRDFEYLRILMNFGGTVRGK